MKTMLLMDSHADLCSEGRFQKKVETRKRIVATMTVLNKRGCMEVLVPQMWIYGWDNNFRSLRQQVKDADALLHYFEDLVSCFLAGPKNLISLVINVN